MKIIVDSETFEIDEEDIGYLESNKWSIYEKRKGSKYLVSYKKKNRKTIAVYFHRLVMGCKIRDGKIIDHINGDTQDNRKCNLRKCTYLGNAQNARTPTTNTSGYKGIVFRKDRGKWYAKISCNKKRHYLGLYDTKEEAYIAYCEASRKYHGEYGRIK